MHFSAWCVEVCVLCHVSVRFLHLTYFCLFLWPTKGNSILCNPLLIILDSDPFFLVFFFLLTWIFTDIKHSDCSRSDITSSFIVCFIKILSCFCCLEFWSYIEIIQLGRITVTGRNTIWRYWTILHWSGWGIYWKYLWQ